MRRAIAACALVAVLLPLGRDAGAQARLLDVTGDSLVAIPAGGVGTARLEIAIANGMSSYSVTLFYDQARVSIIGADSFPGWPFPAPSVDNSTAGQTTLAASVTGIGTLFTHLLANVHFRLDGAALEGSLVSIRVNALTAADGVTNQLPSIRTQTLNLCHAAQVWGDVDNSLSATSRDALVILRATVGLSTAGFDLTRADVDRDQQVTTRDVLFILSRAIGVLGVSRAGVGIPDRCAPLATAPAAFAFNRGGTLYRIAAGDSIPIAFSTNTTYESGASVRWAPDGSAVVATRFIGSSNEVVKVDTAVGGPETRLTNNTVADDGADWAPDGTRIAFISSSVPPSAVWVMNANGTNPVKLTPTTHVVSPIFQSNVAWSPDGSKIAFTAYVTCCTTKLWTMNADGSNLLEVFPSSESLTPRDPVWSPAGDSLVFQNSSDGRLYQTGATGATGAVVASQLITNQEWVSWIGAGQAFRSRVGPTFDWYLRQNTGRHVRLVRAPGTVDNGGSFRRPSTYVNVVTVAAGQTTLNVGGTPNPSSTTATATVLDNLTAAITPGSGLQWTSSDPNVTVTPSGPLTATVTATAPPSANPVVITASAGGWRVGTVNITVNP